MAVLRNRLKNIPVGATDLLCNKNCGLPVSNDGPRLYNDATTYKPPKNGIQETTNKSTIPFYSPGQLSLNDLNNRVNTNKELKEKQYNDGYVIPMVKYMANKLEGFIYSPIKHSRLQSKHLLDDIKKSCTHNQIKYLAAFQEKLNSESIERASSIKSDKKSKKKLFSSTEVKNILKKDNHIVGKRNQYLMINKTMCMKYHIKKNYKVKLLAFSKLASNDKREEKMLEPIQNSKIILSDDSRKNVLQNTQKRYYHKLMMERLKRDGTKSKDGRSEASSENEMKQPLTLKNINTDLEFKDIFSVLSNNKRYYKKPSSTKLSHSSSSSTIFTGKKLHLNMFLANAARTSPKFFNPFRTDYKEYSTENIKRNEPETRLTKSDHILREFMINNYDDLDIEDSTKQQTGFYKMNADNDGNGLLDGDNSLLTDNIKGLMLTDYLDQGIKELMSGKSLNSDENRINQHIKTHDEDFCQLHENQEIENFNENNLCSTRAFLPLPNNMKLHEDEILPKHSIEKEDETNITRKNHLEELKPSEPTQNTEDNAKYFTDIQNPEEFSYKRLFLNEEFNNVFKDTELKIYSDDKLKTYFDTDLQIPDNTMTSASKQLMVDTTEENYVKTTSENKTLADYNINIITVDESDIQAEKIMLPQYSTSFDETNSLKHKNYEPGNKLFNILKEQSKNIEQFNQFADRTSLFIKSENMINDLDIASIKINNVMEEKLNKLKMSIASSKENKNTVKPLTTNESINNNETVNKLTKTTHMKHPKEYISETIKLAGLNKSKLSNKTEINDKQYKTKLTAKIQHSITGYTEKSSSSDFTNNHAKSVKDSYMKLMNRNNAFKPSANETLSGNLFKNKLSKKNETNWIQHSTTGWNSTNNISQNKTFDAHKRFANTNRLLDNNFEENTDAKRYLNNKSEQEYQTYNINRNSTNETKPSYTTKEFAGAIKNKNDPSTKFSSKSFDLTTSFRKNNNPEQIKTEIKQSMIKDRPERYVYNKKTNLKTERSIDGKQSSLASEYNNGQLIKNKMSPPNLNLSNTKIEKKHNVPTMRRDVDLKSISTDKNNYVHPLAKKFELNGNINSTPITKTLNTDKPRSYSLYHKLGNGDNKKETKDSKHFVWNKSNNLQERIDHHKNKLNSTEYKVENTDKDAKHYDFAIKINPDEKFKESAKQIKMSKIANNATEPFGTRAPENVQKKLFDSFHNNFKQNLRTYDYSLDMTKKSVGNIDKTSRVNTHTYNTGMTKKSVGKLDKPSRINTHTFNTDNKKKITNTEIMRDSHQRAVFPPFNEKVLSANKISESNNLSGGNIKRNIPQIENLHTESRVRNNKILENPQNQIPSGDLSQKNSLNENFQTARLVKSRDVLINNATISNEVKSVKSEQSLSERSIVNNKSKNFIDLFSDIKDRALKFFSSKNLNNSTKPYKKVRSNTSIKNVTDSGSKRGLQNVNTDGSKINTENILKTDENNDLALNRYERNEVETRASENKSQNKTLESNRKLVTDTIKFNDEITNMASINNVMKHVKLNSINQRAFHTNEDPKYRTKDNTHNFKELKEGPINSNNLDYFLKKNRSFETYTSNGKNNKTPNLNNHINNEHNTKNLTQSFGKAFKSAIQFNDRNEYNNKSGLKSTATPVDTIGRMNKLPGSNLYESTLVVDKEDGYKEYKFVTYLKKDRSDKQMTKTETPSLNFRTDINKNNLETPDIKFETK